jgi:hypothetical protein
MNDILDNISNEPLQPSISPATQKQIDKLIAADMAQRSRTDSYYEKMRKDEPHRYRSETGQRHRDAIALGDAFYDMDNE